MRSRTTIRFVYLAILASSLACSTRALAGDFDKALELIREARGTFRVTTADDVASAKAEAVAKMNALGGILDAAGANGQAWKKYLSWNRLAAQLTGEVAVDATELASLLERFRCDYAGLELPAIMQFRAALRRYYYRILALGNEELREEFVQRLEQLRELVEALRKTLDSEVLQKISAQLSWFQRREQVPAVVTAIRDLAPAANIRLHVSRSFIIRTTREPIDRVDPMTDYVLGTTVHGTSHLVGTMAAFPVASDREVRLEARLRGDANTTGRGYNGPIRAKLVGVASVQVMGAILFGPEGFQVGRTRAHVSATGRPTSMWTTCNSRIANGLVTCVAKRRAARTQELGDCIASRHAEQRLSQQVGEELRTRLDALQHGYLTQFRNPLLRHEIFPRTFRATSQVEGAQVEMLLAGPMQTGAPHPPPASPGQAALRAQIHETAVNNLAARLLAGRTVSELELREVLGKLFGDESKKTRGDASDALHIVLADERPLTFQLDNSVVTVKVRADRFIKNRTRFPAMNMIIRYRVQKTGEEVVATQSSEPEVVPRDFEKKGRRRLGAREVAARRLITSMLERELAKTYRLGTFTLPKPADAHGALAITQLTADDGWLDISAEPVAEATRIQKKQ